VTAPTYKFGDLQMDISRFESRRHDRPLQLAFPWNC